MKILMYCWGYINKPLTQLGEIMRISTSSIYTDAVDNFNLRQVNIANISRTISSGIKLNSPDVNPSASAQVLIATQAASVNSQYGVNRQNAKAALSTADSVLSGVTTIMQNLMSQVVAAGNGSLNAEDRRTLAAQFQNQAEQLLSLANKTDSNGNYLFSGTAAGVVPYTTSSNGAQYNGNQVSQFIEVGSFQQLAVTLVGSNVFGNIQVSPNAYFGFADANNSSTAVISNGSVTNLPAVTMDSYAIQFTSPTTFDVVNTSTNTTVSTNNSYTSGAPITIDGVQFTITDGSSGNGTPADGDQFFVQPGNQNIFQVLGTLANALKQSIGTPGDQTNLSNAVAQANTSIKAALGNVLTSRSQLGDGLQRISALNGIGDVMNISYQTRIGDLQNTDYPEAISQLAMEQFVYEAAQKVFFAASQVSLINLL